jgi:hypothetical protein
VRLISLLGRRRLLGQALSRSGAAIEEIGTLVNEDIRLPFDLAAVARKQIELFAGHGHGANLLRPQRCARAALDFWRAIAAQGR